MTMRADGFRLCDGVISAALSMNDPRWQGVGGVGWDHFRDLPGVPNTEPEIWTKGWELLAHRKAGPDPFGVSTCRVLVDPYVTPSGEARASFEVDFVDRYSAAAGKRVMCVRYDYIFGAAEMKCWITIAHSRTAPITGRACT
jgi:hypothetical protein